jgi:hypothetical protein
MQRNSINSIMLFTLAPAILFAAGCAGQTSSTPPATGNPDWSITTSFNYDFTNFPKCSATVTKGCVSGFTWGYLQGATPVQLKTSSTSVCSGSSQPQACSDAANGVVGIGSITPYVVANGVDNNGASVSSTQVNGSPVAVNIGAVSNVGMTLQ